MPTGELVQHSEPSYQSEYESLAAALAVELARVNRLLQGPELWNSTNQDTLLRELLARLSQILEDHRIEYRYHTGEPWVDGLPLTVVHIRDGASDPVVVDTIRPSIAMNDQIISHGYVVIGDKSELEQT